MRRRCEKELQEFRRWSISLGISVTQLAGFILYNENAIYKKQLAGVGWTIFNNMEPKIEQRVSLLEAMWLMERAEISETVYLEMR